MPGSVLSGSYSPGLVALSIAIAILASYVALDLAGRVTAATGRGRAAWLLGGAVAMGTGIWSMHYIGMLAFRLPIPVRYDWVVVLLSWLAAILASAGALFVTSRATMGLVRAAVGSIFMGSGIASMHYIGMGAMRLPASHVYDPGLVTLSVVLAIAISGVALSLTFHHRGGTKELDWRKIGSAVVMGAAIPVMHYTGMAAVTFAPMAMVHGDTTYAVGVTSLGLIGILGVTFMVLGLAGLSALMDRHVSARLEEDVDRREFILNAAAIGMWERSLVTQGVVWSDTMEAVHGIPIDAVTQTREGFLASVHHEDRPRIIDAYEQCVRDGTDYTVHYRRIRADGSIHWIESTGRLRRDAAGRGVKVVGVDRDITERKRAEAALIESERAYRSTFEAAPTGMAHVSLDGRWLRVNRRLCEILGYSRDELLAHDLFELVHPDDRRAETEAFEQVAAGTVERCRGERRLRRPDGTYVTTLVNLTAHREATGAAKYIIKIFDDMTERKTLEAALRQAQKMDAVGQLAGGVAHDFNNLLTVIGGFSRLLLANRRVTGGIRRDITEISNASDRAAALTRQLLAFGRRQAFEVRVLDLNEVIGGMDQILRRLLGERVDLSLELAANLDCVAADQNQIEQVVLNLAVNARDAMPSGGTVQIRTANVTLDHAFVAKRPGASPGPHVAVAVADTGTGIDSTALTHLFEPFFTTKPPGKGTGLGLATVYGVVKQSNGYIDVETAVGRGSTFTVYLPRTARLMTGAPPEAAQPETHGAETILLVEDQYEVRRVAREVLLRSGYTVIEAASGDEALAQLAQGDGSIELLLTDVVMPGIGGRDLARQVTAAHRDIRTLYMSGYANVLVGQDGVLDPGLAFLQKPFTPAGLLQKVRDVLDAAAPPRI